VGDNAGVTTEAPRKASRGESWTIRLRARFARSRRVFLMSLVIACGIEVMVDWNTTLFEINVLRGRVSERGMSYVHILAGAADEAMQKRNAKVLAQLSEGLFADEQVVFVRFVDTAGDVLYEELQPRYAAQFQRRRAVLFAAYYAKQIARDLSGVMHDPEGQRDRMAKSRYRDFPQRWNDAMSAMMAKVVAPPPAKKDTGLVLYQQALRTDEHERDDAVTWAFGTITAPAGPVGAVLVAFDMGPTNDSIQSKYLKGLGMVLFFVGLILFQNVSSRQDKLRLLDIERRYAEAKRAIREALPGVVRAGDLSAFGALDQAAGTVDGQIFVLSAHQGAIDALVIDPDGAGIEAAAIALQARQAFTNRRAEGPATDLLVELASLGDAGSRIPLSRPLGVILVHVESSGAVTALSGPLGGLCVLGGGDPRHLAPLEQAAAPVGVVGPIRRFEAHLGPGHSLVVGSSGIAEGDAPPRLDVAALAGFLARSLGAGPLRQDIVEDAAIWVRGRAPRLARSDVVVLAVTRG
jgi:hypothetical protein